MQTPVKAHRTRLCILSLLLLVWGTLLPAYACPPEVGSAIARLQKSAKAEISVGDWSAQIISKTAQDSEEGSQEALFFDKPSFPHLKQYLADVEIRQNTHGEWEAPQKFQLSKRISFTYYHIYPFSISHDKSPESACQLGIKSIMANEVEGWEFVVETVTFYFFDIEDGEMKLIRIDVAG